MAKRKYIYVEKCPDWGDNYKFYYSKSAMNNGDHFASLCVQQIEKVTNLKLNFYETAQIELPVKFKFKKLRNHR